MKWLTILLMLCPISACHQPPTAPTAQYAPSQGSAFIVPPPSRRHHYRTQSAGRPDQIAAPDQFEGVPAADEQQEDNLDAQLARLHREIRDLSTVINRAKAQTAHQHPADAPK